MMGEGRIPFLVLGGGIGGVAAALSLARRGRRVHVLEKATELAEIRPAKRSHRPVRPRVKRIFS